MSLLAYKIEKTNKAVGINLNNEKVWGYLENEGMATFVNNDGFMGFIEVPVEALIHIMRNPIDFGIGMDEIAQLEKDTKSFGEDDYVTYMC